MAKRGQMAGIAWVWVRFVVGELVGCGSGGGRGVGCLGETEAGVEVGWATPRVGQSSSHIGTTLGEG